MIYEDSTTASLHNAGKTRTSSYGNTFSVGVAPEDIDVAMNEFDVWYKSSRRSMQPIELATRAFQRIVTVHPFPNGNGRTARLVMDWILELNGFPPATFPDGKSAEVGRTPRRVVGFDGTKAPSRDVPIDRALSRVTAAVANTLKILERALK